MGSIPIVWHSPLDGMLRDLPVMTIYHHEDITQQSLSDFIHSTRHQRSPHDFQWDKLFAFWWLQQIELDRRRPLVVDGIPVNWSTSLDA